jgi:enediyne biosynthesis protein E4
LVMVRWFWILFFAVLHGSCKQPLKMFIQLSASQTGVDFINTLQETKENNVLTYEYFYNGCGVAAGDLNGDGLADLYFSGNQVPAKLYLNKGDFRFTDITAAAGVAGKDGWKTGVSFADVNGDGRLDIYVCYSGFGDTMARANQLFVNNGNDASGIPDFSENATAYGLDAPGTYSSQAAFFDYDRDGDLDMFLLNHANGFYSPFFNTTRLRHLRHPQFGNRLYQNNGGKFVDVSEQAGIYGSGINFGLGLAVSDINGDGWPDLYVSNDFEEQDFCYLNNKDGSFKEVCQQLFAHISRSTMGLDIADYNNDLLPDVVTVDMLPEDNHRQKILQGADQYDKYNLMVDSGYGHQNTRNMLQLNRGLGKDSLPLFSEIGQLANVSNTDWSWSALLTDLDNDGWKDLFITNGFLRDYTNLDFVKYDVANAMKAAVAAGKDISTRQKYQQQMPLFDLIKKMPSSKLRNYAFRNTTDLSFANETVNWGLEEPGVSNGASYADLDNDGDLDLIVCNNNAPVWLYQNNRSAMAANHYVQVKLNGRDKNKFAIGAKVTVCTRAGKQLQELFPVRGYQSSVDYPLHFGLGDDTAIVQIQVAWPDGRFSNVAEPAINTMVTIDERNADFLSAAQPSQQQLFTDITSGSGLDFTQHENNFVDFKQEFLIPYELSKQGPKLCAADVNGDGLDDVFVGAPAGETAVLFMQNGEAHFTRAKSQPWSADKACEDIGALFFDADQDGDADLYVVSGGSEWLHPGVELQDRLYANDGKGNFTKLTAAIPNEVLSGSCVKAADFDQDGDLDLFVGARTVPGHYPLTGGNILLRNDFNKKTNSIRFTNVVQQLAGDAIFKAGMVTDAVWTDLDKDGWPELIVVGDWMPVKIFKNSNGKFTDVTTQLGLKNTDGWWCKILPTDIDNDGDIDFIAGNMGINTQFKPSAKTPLTTYVSDFNNDGKIDPVLTWYVQGKNYLFNSRDEMAEQLPAISKHFLKYSDYADAGIEEVADGPQINAAKKIFVKELHSSILRNNGQGLFSIEPLPPEIQFSAVSGIVYDDFDGDGKKDILTAGNFFPFRVQQGRCDAGMGSLLKGEKNGKFNIVSRQITNLQVLGDVRDMIAVKSKIGNIIIVSKNNAAMQVLKNNK